MWNQPHHQSSVDPFSTVPWVFHISHVACYKVPNATMSPRGRNDFDMIGARAPFLDFCNPLDIRVRLHIPNLRSLAVPALIAKNPGRGSVMSSSYDSRTPCNPTSVCRPVLGKSPYGAIKLN